MQSFHHELPATTPQAELDALIDALNADPAVHGILVQSPLPGDLDEARAFARIESRQGRRRLPPRERRPARAQPPGTALVHARRA